MYDVIIIGAGPAGSMAAKELADSGYKVLLVEKELIPREKSCSGILIKRTMDFVKTHFGEAVPEYVQCNPTNNKGMIFVNDSGKEYRFEQEGLNIWRDSFDSWLVQKAEQAGAEVRQATTALACSEEEGRVYVTLKSSHVYTETAQIVISCEGAVGKIKRNLLHTPQNYIVTYQTFSKGSIDLDSHYFYAFLQPEFSEYDAWFNVKDEYLIFGVAVKNQSTINHYHNSFLSYMSTCYNAKVTKPLKSEKWIMPHILPECVLDLGKGKILFAGETAGFLNPMGEGISCALESGYAVAQAIKKNYVRDQEVNSLALLATYTKEVEYTRQYMKRQWHFVSNISSKFAHMEF